MPGEDQRRSTRPCAWCSASCRTCRTCPSCPAAGRGADMTGRALALLAGLGVDLQPAGWRLTDAPGHRPPPGASRCWPRTSTRSRSSRRATPGRSRCRSPGRGRSPRRSRSPAATRCSPTTAPAASSPRRWPRGCATTSPTCAAGCPGADAARAGRRAGAAGRARRAGSRPPPASTGTARSTRRGGRRALEWVLRRDRGGRAPSRSCTAAPPTSRSTCCRGAGAPGISVDLDVLAAAAYDALADGRSRRGAGCCSGWCPSTRPGDRARRDGQVTERVLRLLDMLGLEPGPRLVVTPSCGLAGAAPAGPGPRSACRQGARDLELTPADVRRDSPQTLAARLGGRTAVERWDYPVG